MFLVLRTLVYVTSRSSAHSTPPGLVMRAPPHYKHPTPPGLMSESSMSMPFQRFLPCASSDTPKLPASLFFVACGGTK
jgi:hypothetical protein